MLRQRFMLFAALSLSAATLHAQVYLGTSAGNPGGSTGNFLVALGDSALGVNTTGSNNTVVGEYACSSNTTGSNNTAVGTYASGSNITSSDNTAVGYFALLDATGSGNIAVGSQAGVNLTSGSNNIEIGNTAPGNESNTIRIGSTQTATFIAGVNGATASGGVEVFVNTSGKLGTLTSSRRFKEDIVDMGAASDSILKLRPVSFHYKAGYDDGSHLLQYGLVAEEVAMVAPSLVQYDALGQPFTVRYQAVNAMLVNEVQKQHAKVEAQAAELASQRSQIEAQEARIQRLEALLSQKDMEPKAP